VTVLWTAAEVRAATGGEGPGGWTARDVSIDTRTLEPGALFVALHGPRHDGHDFLAEARRRGAAAALVSRVPADAPADLPLMRVSDTLVALRHLADAARRRSRAVRLAVTGSVGKTTTKEMLRLALAAFGPVHASAASHNNRVGVPLTLARLPAETRFAVLEMGMNRPGEIGDHARLVRPRLAAVTRIAPAHIGAFRDLAAIADAKAEILDGTPPPEIAVLPADDGQLPRLLARARARGVAQVVTFGLDVAATVRGRVESEGPEGQRLAVLVDGRELTLGLAAPGRHLAHDALLVLAAVTALGLDPRPAAATLARFRPLAGRGRRLRLHLPTGGTALLLDEAYNANPASMRAALAVLATLPARRRLAVLGEMAELGAHAPRLHAGLAEAVLAAGVDRLYTRGAAMEALRARLPAARLGPVTATLEELETVIVEELREGDVLLVKGSLASGLVPLVTRLAGRFAAEEV